MRYGLYYQFALPFRDIEEMLASRGVTVSYEAVRLWCGKFGAEYARRLRRYRSRVGRRWHVDEVSIRISGTIHYLWRAVDQNGQVVDILVQKRGMGLRRNVSFAIRLGGRTLSLTP
jgi:putative transposase